jgi:hypothetical protein
VTCVLREIAVWNDGSVDGEWIDDGEFWSGAPLLDVSLPIQDEAGLAVVEEALARTEGRETTVAYRWGMVVLLRAKCRYLSQRDRLNEALAACKRALEVADGRDSGFPDSEARRQAAWAGAATAAALAGRKQRKPALALVDEVVCRFAASDDPGTRAAVAVAMGVEILALKQARRWPSATKALVALTTFLGPTPEPDVVRVLEKMPEGERWLRIAREHG